MQRLKVFLAILGVLVAGELGVRAWAGVVDPEQVVTYDASTDLRIEQLDARPDAHVDVVFAGTSMAWQGFVPDAFSAADPLNRSAFNAGVDGGVPTVMHQWLRDEIVPRTTPQTVIWGISALDFSSAFGDQALERYEQAPGHRADAAGRFDRFVGDYSAIVRWRRVLRSPSDWIDGIEEDAISTARSLVGPGGERRDFEIIKTDVRESILQSRLRPAGFDVADVEALTQAVNELSASGIEVVLVHVPVPSQFVQAFPDGAAGFDRSRAEIAALAASLRVDFLDYSRTQPDERFVDFTHLDESGAREFSTALASNGEVDPPETIALPAPTESTDQSDLSECTTEVVRDEYGFEIEILDCPEGASVEGLETREITRSNGTTTEVLVAPTPGAAVVAEGELSGDAVQVLREFIRDDIISGCDRTTFVELLPLGPFDDSRERLSQLAQQVREHCASGDAVAWEATLGEVATLVDEIAEYSLRPENTATLIIGSAEDRELDALRERWLGYAELAGTDTAGATYQRLVATTEALYALSGEWQTLITSDFWGSTHHAKRIADLELLRLSGQTPDIMIVGSSIARTGVDAEAIADQTGSSVFNASLQGAWFDGGTWWFVEQGQDYGPTDHLVIEITLDPFVGFRCPGPNYFVLLDSLERGNSAFGLTSLRAGEFLAEVGINDRSAGVRRILERELWFSSGSLLDRQMSPTAIATTESDARDFIAGLKARTCDPDLTAFETATAAAQARGARVTWLLMPMNPITLNADPAWESIAQAGIDEIGQAATAADAVFIDLARALDQEGFRDRVHVSASGAEIVTEALVESLTAE